MKNIFDSKDEKITEKAFVQSVVISVVGILLCIVALCSVTFCWFTGETESNSNTLVSGTFDVEIKVEKGDTIPETEAEGEQADAAAAADSEKTEETEATIEVKADPNQQGVWVCELPGAGTYTVTLTLKDGSTVKGHCVVCVGNDATKKHTDAIIGEHTANPTDLPESNPFTFTITVTEADLTDGTVTVTFEPRWGVVVEPDIPNEGAYPKITQSGTQSELGA